MWKVGGIKIERTPAQNFFHKDISEKWNFLIFVLLLGNGERYWDGKSVEGDKIRSVSKNMRGKKNLSQVSKLKKLLKCS